ncbi:DJ-1/PfpI family protein [Candidatus Parcubacteria bacterium]|nr:DJ-1/PfpI family protein [Patescibacteria group bacterium]MBU4466802.1 DJ-1/PfpI family protein [Patescibacteria group bacterium]MCG2688450.1 DJ-1/PfpI family protein [Candidatus Parcubacteria bacterium]
MPIEKKIALVIAFRDFNDEEYLIPKQAFETVGFKTITVSNNLGQAIGAYGNETEVSLLLKDLKVKDFDAIVFIGGSGSARYLDDPNAHRLALEAILNKKILGAICIAPAILAKAGVLKNRKATVWSSNMDKSFIEILRKEKANYMAEPVVTDGKIITASGPATAKAFATTVIEKLK